ncbi:leucine-rich repeat-containing G-protein coupled receptor 5-like [Osmia bicornis bicornis]|uniref:leucine-rich repeat-containing G-protein coupled receptor 5-like n=1 Tax=Osmia bicornis bicornis TaxID=1437191 RepID=UPI001EAEC1BE|nr:leucine-rich repeat-containing G-protein coupled receptor 5-like [Osmia bicornis bicornis]
MIAMTNPILAIVIIALINITASAIINFDSNAKSLDIDVILKRPRLICEDNEESLNLSDNKLTKIETGFIKSSTIRSISLNNNEIQEIPNGVFDHVPNLECLDLRNNQIPTSQLLNLKHNGLKTLIFDDQKPAKSDISTNDVPFNTSEVGLPNVETLSLKGIYYDHFELHSNLFPSLSTIFFINNYLQYINPNLVEYFNHHLRSIHFEQNDLRTVTLNDLKNVEELYFDNNPIEYLEIKTHPNLKILSLANCDLGGEWYLSLFNIDTLDLSGNRMSESIISEKFSEVSNLENLSLSRNKFTTIPHLDNLPRLKKLSLSYNMIESISDVIHAGSLKTLDLQGNRINDIHPGAFWDVPMLEKLDLSHNQLYVLDYRWGENLSMLRSLNLKSNRFATISHMNIRSLSNIKDVYVGNNYFHTIHSTDILYLPNNYTIYVC